MEVATILVIHPRLCNSVAGLRATAVKGHKLKKTEAPIRGPRLKGQYHGRIVIFGQNSLNLNFEHCVN